MAFLKSRKKAPPSEVGGASLASRVGGALSHPVVESEVPAVSVDETGVYEASQAGRRGGVAEGGEAMLGNQVVKVTPPGGWLHMDRLERDKLEWTTDVPPTPPKPELDRTETRFSFNGLVIPRTVTSIPSHVGLHHHGNEPQVRHTLLMRRLCLYYRAGSWLYSAGADISLQELCAAAESAESANAVQDHAQSPVARVRAAGGGASDGAAVRGRGSPSPSLRPGRGNRGRGDGSCAGSPLPISAHHGPGKCLKCPL